MNKKENLHHGRKRHQRTLPWSGLWTHASSVEELASQLGSTKINVYFQYKVRKFHTRKNMKPRTFIPLPSVPPTAIKNIDVSVQYIFRNSVCRSLKHVAVLRTTFSPSRGTSTELATAAETVQLYFKFHAQKNKTNLECKTDRTEHLTGTEVQSFCPQSRDMWPCLPQT